MHCPVCHSKLATTDHEMWETWETMDSGDEAQRQTLYICTNPSCQSNLFNIAWTVGDGDTPLMHRLEAEQDVLL